MNKLFYKIVDKFYSIFVANLYTIKDFGKLKNEISK